MEQTPETASQNTLPPVVKINVKSALPVVSGLSVIFAVGAIGLFVPRVRDSITKWIPQSVTAAMKQRTPGILTVSLSTVDGVLLQAFQVRINVDKPENESK